MNVFLPSGDELPVSNNTADPVLLKSCETDDQILFHGTRQDFENILMILCPEPGGEKPEDPTAYIPDDVRQFVEKFKEEGY